MHSELNLRMTTLKVTDMKVAFWVVENDDSVRHVTLDKKNAESTMSALVMKAALAALGVSEEAWNKAVEEAKERFKVQTVESKLMLPKPSDLEHRGIGRGKAID